MDYANKDLLGSIRKSSLARLVGMSKSSVTNLINKMKEKHLISVEPYISLLARRKVLLTLSASMPIGIVGL